MTDSTSVVYLVCVSCSLVLVFILSYLSMAAKLDSKMCFYDIYLANSILFLILIISLFKTECVTYGWVLLSIRPIIKCVIEFLKKLERFTLFNFFFIFFILFSLLEYIIFHPIYHPFTPIYFFISHLIYLFHESKKWIPVISQKFPTELRSP